MWCRDRPGRLSGIPPTFASSTICGDSIAPTNSDGFSWSPVIKDAKTGEILTSAAGEFGKKPDRQSALSTFAQILLTSNEFIFAD